MWDEIKEHDEACGENLKVYGPSIMQRRHLIEMVEELAGAAGHNGRCPFDWYATKRGATLEDIAFCDTVSCEQTREERTECWLKLADKQAGEK
jgi:hypothetical protein